MPRAREQLRIRRIREEPRTKSSSRPSLTRENRLCDCPFSLSFFFWKTCIHRFSLFSALQTTAKERREPMPDVAHEDRIDGDSAVLRLGAALSRFGG
jgi:hypothetical protein